MTSKIKVDNINKVSDDSNIIKKCGTTITIGSCGASVALASGATQTGFGRTGTVDWCTTAKTSPFTAVSGDGFFVNTSAGVITVTLPASPSAGDIVAFADYASTWATNNVTLCRNSSLINGGSCNPKLSVKGQSVTLVYVDGTKGWKTVTDSTANVTGAPDYVTATGGTITTSGDYKIHTFTSSGPFNVSSSGTSSGSNKVSYLVVAGGGGAQCAGAGGGGFREGKVSGDPYTASPLVAPDGLSVPETNYTITVGAAGSRPSGSSNTNTNGGVSTFSTITSAGGGKAGFGTTGVAGGSGGGSTSTTGGAGNTPPVSPPQGNPGGTASGYSAAGGGATAAGGNYPGPHAGGTGATSSITASPLGFSGGGGGASPGGGSVAREPTGSGGAGIAGAQSAPGTQCGVTNRGGGGGGVYCGTQGNGGSGIVVIRYKFQN
jgi:hypothetical protein